MVAQFLLVAAVVVLAGAVAARAANRLRAPALLFFLAIGIVISTGFDVGAPEPALAQDLAFAATAVILAEGGLTARLSAVRSILGPAISLATIGVLVSTAAVAAIVLVTFDVDRNTALLLGAVVASTDAAAVFAVLRRLRLKERSAALLEAESGFNDATAVALVFAVAAAVGGAVDWPGAIVEIGYELLVGGLVGAGVSLLGRALLVRIALPGAGLYPLAVLALSLGAYAAADLLHASAFLAVYVAALLLGGADLPHRASTLSFVDGAAWLAQIGLFVLLGLLVDPGEIPGVLGIGVVAAAALLLVARPLSVAVSLAAFGIGVREMAFLSWGGLRGAVPIVFATIPLSLQTPLAVEVFTATFVVVVLLTAIQAPLLPWVADRTGVSEPDALAELEVESAPLDESRALLLGMQVPARSRLVGVTIPELRLPAGAVVTLIIRGGQSVPPDQFVRIRPDDRLLIVADAATRTATLERIRQVSAGGALAGWLSGRAEEGGDDLRGHPYQRQAAARVRRSADQEQPRDR